MILKTKNKTISLVYRTRKIVKITNLLGGKNFESLYFNAFSQNDIEALAKVIWIFAEDENSGVSSFKTSDEVLDFFDDYMAETNKSYKDIYTEIAEDINNQGFFTKKMTEAELKTRISSPLSVDMDTLIEQSATKAIQSIATEEIKNSLV